MIVHRGLATTISELSDKFIADLISASGGVLVKGLYASAVLDGAITIRAQYHEYEEEEGGETVLKNASPYVTISYRGATTPLLSPSNLHTHSLAYEIRSSASGDVLVKFAQWTSTEPLDIFAESFQSWGIGAYDTSNAEVAGDFLDRYNLDSFDMLPGMNYGGFLLHKMKQSDSYGITIFHRDTLSPIYTWIKDGPLAYEDGNKYVSSSGMGSYTERVRRFASGTGTADRTKYTLLVQEPYNYPKDNSAVEYAVLAPIFTPSTGGDYSKTSRWLLQSPHMYNPFDSDGYLLIDGGDQGAFFCDHGICLSAKGDDIVSTGLVLPKPVKWMHWRMGDYPRSRSGTETYGIYGHQDIEY